MGLAHVVTGVIQAYPACVIAVTPVEQELELVFIRVLCVSVENLGGVDIALAGAVEGRGVWCLVVGGCRNQLWRCCRSHSRR